MEASKQQPDNKLVLQSRFFITVSLSPWNFPRLPFFDLMFCPIDDALYHEDDLWCIYQNSFIIVAPLELRALLHVGRALVWQSN
jgi:hypothetical protein